jgi:hypothetical protein
MATQHLTQHPTLHEALLPFYTHDDVSDVVRTLEAINRDHLNQGELLQLDFELPKLRRYSSMPGVVKVSIERLMGLRPPRRHKDCAVFTYLDPLTAKLEHLSITRTLEKLRGTKLGIWSFTTSGRNISSQNTCLLPYSPALFKTLRRTWHH